jgi:hypothetical protein
VSPVEFEAKTKALADELTRLDLRELMSEPLQLDYSPASLARLDGLVAAVRAKADMPVELKRGTGQAMGAYLAEVVRRRSPVALRWVSAEVLPTSPGPLNPFVLATPKNLVFVVLGKPYELVVTGGPDTLVAFAERIQELCSREATQTG